MVPPIPVARLEGSVFSRGADSSLRRRQYGSVAGADEYCHGEKQPSFDTKDAGAHERVSGESFHAAS